MVSPLLSVFQGTPAPWPSLPPPPHAEADRYAVASASPYDDGQMKLYLIPFAQAARHLESK